MADIDTLNRFFVGARGDKVVILKFRTEISREEALNLAAWLVAIADHDGEFEMTLAAVRGAKDPDMRGEIVRRGTANTLEEAEEESMKALMEQIRADGGDPGQFVFTRSGGRITATPKK